MNIRTALVKSSVDLARVEAYLPSNYEASVNENGYVVITGHGYVLPRLASGLIFASEVTA